MQARHGSGARRWGISAGVVFAIWLCAALVGARGDEPDGETTRIQALLAQSREATAAVHDYTGVLVKRERFGDEIVEQTIAFKFSRPFKVYLGFIDPYEGREGIYVRGRNQNKIRLHRGAPFDFNVSSYPRSRVAMRDNHHPITSFGVERMLGFISRNVQRGIRRGDVTFDLSDGGLVDGEPTWCIEIHTKPGKGRYVTVQADENLWQLAKRAHQNMYVILHHNDQVDSPTDIREGQKIFVPYHYASRGKYFISKRSLLAVKAVSWDHDGRFYESYEYTKLQLNPGLTDADFDPDNEKYGF